MAWVDPGSGDNYNLYCPYTGIYSVLTGGDPVYISSMNQNNFYPIQVANPDGTTYTWSGRYPGNSSIVSKVEDRNGNQIIVSDSGSGNFSVVDTLGRNPVLASSGFGGNGNTYTLTVSGLSNPYTIHWGQAVTPSYTFNQQKVQGPYCSGLNAVSVPSQPVITEIDLPDGEKYQFQYDSTYGLLNKITYPSGGYVRYVWALSSYNSGTLSDDTAFTDSQGNRNGCVYNYDSPAVLSRYVSFDGVNEILQQNFTYTTYWNGAVWTSKKTSVTTTVNTVANGAMSTVGTYTTTYMYTGVPPQQDPYEYPSCRPIAARSGICWGQRGKEG
jgi:hypothetical protein